MRSLPSWLPLLTPAILVIVASLQIYRANVRDLTPWKGGGFGMFASVDSRGGRILRAYARVDGKDIPISIPCVLSDRASKFRAEPDESALQRLADDLSGMTWYDRNLSRAAEKRLHLKEQGLAASAIDASSDDEPRLRVVKPGAAPPPPQAIVPLDEIRLELWRRKFDESTATASRELQFQATAAFPGKRPTTENGVTP